VQGLLSAPRLKVTRQSLKRGNTETPHRVVKPVAFEDNPQLKRIVIGFGLTKVLKQFGPAIFTWRHGANFVQ
jgi:hypothetical protein